MIEVIERNLLWTVTKCSVALTCIAYGVLWRKKKVSRLLFLLLLPTSSALFLLSTAPEGRFAEWRQLLTDGLVACLCAWGPMVLLWMALSRTQAQEKSK